MAKGKFFFSWNNSKLFFILGIVLVVIFSVAASKEFVKKHQLDEEISGLEQEIETLQVQQDKFLTLIDNYNSESFIEQEARTKFNYKKRGEKVVIIKTDENNIYLDSENNLPNDINSSTGSDNSGSNLKRWWDYFFGERHI